MEFRRSQLAAFSASPCRQISGYRANQQSRERTTAGIFGGIVEVIIGASMAGLEPNECGRPGSCLALRLPISGLMVLVSANLRQQRGKILARILFAHASDSG